MASFRFPVVATWKFPLLGRARVGERDPRRLSRQHRHRVLRTPDPIPSNNTASATTSVIACTITGAGDIAGTAGNDVICGSAGADRIAGLGGNDVIFGLAGDDQLSGGDGDDVLLGGDGSDQLSGGNGNDQLYGGGGGVDRLSGGPGDDYLNTVDGSTDDYMIGSEHVTGDRCVGDPGDAKALCEL